MSIENLNEQDPDIQNALNELKEIIQRRYPEAAFDVSRGEDPEGLYLRATVDIEDVDEIFDKPLLDRLFDAQVEKRLPVYVLPLQPVERVLEEMNRPKQRVRSRIELEDIRPPSQP